MELNAYALLSETVNGYKNCARSTNVVNIFVRYYTLSLIERDPNWQWQREAVTNLQWYVGFLRDKILALSTRCVHMDSVKVFSIRHYNAVALLLCLPVHVKIVDNYFLDPPNVSHFQLTV